MTVTQEESPSDVLLPGAAIIIGSATYIAHRELTAKQCEVSAPPPQTAGAGDPL